MESILDFTSDLNEVAFNAVKHNRKHFARWAEAIDCLRVDADMAEYREAYEVPAELGQQSAREYILAEMLELHYADLLPSLDCPFGAILLEAFNSVNWLEVSCALFREVK